MAQRDANKPRTNSKPVLDVKATSTAPKNYGVGKLVSLFRTNYYLEQMNNSSDLQLNFYYEVNPSVNRLKLQAEIFAANFEAHGYYNFPRLLRCRDDKVKTNLEDMYIYSYLKCYYVLLFNSELDDSEDLGYCFTGHSRFLNLMLCQGYKQVRDEVFVFNNVRYGSFAKRKLKFSLLVAQFPQFKDWQYSQTALGHDIFSDVNIERHFENIVADFYGKRGYQDENVEGEEDPGLGENANFHKTSSEMNDEGRITICKVRNNGVQTIREEGNRPLNNCFMNTSFTELYYLEVNGTYEVKNNPSFHFNNANFICINEHTDDEILNKFYRSMAIGTRQSFMLCSEVFTITGINCNNLQFNVRQLVATPTIKGVNLKDILDRIEETKDKWNDFIDIVDRISGIVDELTKKENEDEDKGKDPDPKLT